MASLRSLEDRIQTLESRQYRIEQRLDQLFPHLPPGQKTQGLLGKCPYCQQNFVSRDTNPQGNSRCPNGHSIPNSAVEQVFGSVAPE